MFNFLKKLFFRKRTIPKYVQKFYYLLFDTIKPHLVKSGKVLHIGEWRDNLYAPEVIVERELDGGEYDQIVIIDADNNPEPYLPFLKEKGSLWFLRAAFLEPRWKAKNLRKRFPKASVHPVAVHWFLILFKSENA